MALGLFQSQIEEAGRQRTQEAAEVADQPFSFIPDARHQQTAGAT